MKQFYTPPSKIKHTQSTSPKGDEYFSSYVSFVVKSFPPSSSVLEIGAGLHSTKDFSQYFREIHSVESNPDFVGLYDSNYIYCPVDDITGWYDDKRLEQQITFEYDLIILDGPEGLFRPPFTLPPMKVVRGGFYYLNWDLWKKDVPIIVDDTHRPWVERELVHLIVKEGYKATIFEGFTLLEPLT
jgi:hypothetical protein